MNCNPILRFTDKEIEHIKKLILETKKMICLERTRVSNNRIHVPRWIRVNFIRNQVFLQCKYCSRWAQEAVVCENLTPCLQVHIFQGEVAAYVVRVVIAAFYKKIFSLWIEICLAYFWGDSNWSVFMIRALFSSFLKLMLKLLNSGI